MMVTWSLVPGTLHPVKVSPPWMSAGSTVYMHGVPRGRTGGLEKWPCLSELSPPKPNKLRPGRVISDGTYLASAAKARSKRVTFRDHQFKPQHAVHAHSATGGWNFHKMERSWNAPSYGSFTPRYSYGTDHALDRESHHYRLGLTCDLTMWFCWSKLSPPKPNRLRFGPSLRDSWTGPEPIWLRRRKLAPTGPFAKKELHLKARASYSSLPPCTKEKRRQFFEFDAPLKNKN